MKKLVQFLLAFILLAFVSCSDDDNDENTLNFAGKRYKIDTAYILKWQQQDIYSTGLAIGFPSSTLTFEDNPDFDRFLGNGKILYVYKRIDGIVSEFPEGTYSEFDNIVVANVTNDNAKKEVLDLVNVSPMTVMKLDSVNYRIRGTFQKDKKKYSVKYEGPLIPSR
jgi:hypothetical protein